MPSWCFGEMSIDTTLADITFCTPYDKGSVQYLRLIVGSQIFPTQV